jgi:hypothetical protein
MCIDTYSVHWKDVIVFFSFCCLGVGKMMTHCKSFDSVKKKELHSFENRFAASSN